MSLRVEIPWVMVEILGKMEFWVEKGVEEAKWSFWKTVTVWPSKIENPLVSRVSYSRSTCKLLTKCLKCTRLVSREAIFRERVARESRNSLCKILEKMKTSFLIFADRLQDVLLVKTPLMEFFNKTDLAFWKNS